MHAIWTWASIAHRRREQAGLAVFIRLVHVTLAAIVVIIVIVAGMAVAGLTLRAPSTDGSEFPAPGPAPMPIERRLGFYSETLQPDAAQFRPQFTTVVTDGAS